MNKYIESYDPDCDPDPEAWGLINDDERIALVSNYHRKARIKLPNLKAHALFHVIVENQVAMRNKTPVCRTLVRLLAEGLDRHDAIHAIGSVMSKFIFDHATRARPADDDPNLAYWADLETLSAESWRNSE